MANLLSLPNEILDLILQDVIDTVDIPRLLWQDALQNGVEDREDRGGHGSWRYRNRSHLVVQNGLYRPQSPIILVNHKLYQQCRALQLENLHHWQIDVMELNMQVPEPPSYEMFSHNWKTDAHPKPAITVPLWRRTPMFSKSLQSLTLTTTWETTPHRENGDYGQPSLHMWDMSENGQFDWHRLLEKIVMRGVSLRKSYNKSSPPAAALHVQTLRIVFDIQQLCKSDFTSYKELVAAAVILHWRTEKPLHEEALEAKIGVFWRIVGQVTYIFYKPPERATPAEVPDAIQLVSETESECPWYKYHDKLWQSGAMLRERTDEVIIVAPGVEEPIVHLRKSKDSREGPFDLLPCMLVDVDAQNFRQLPERIAADVGLELVERIDDDIVAAAREDARIRQLNADM